MPMDCSECGEKTEIRQSPDRDFPYEFVCPKGHVLKAKVIGGKSWKIGRMSVQNPTDRTDFSS